MSSTSSPQSLHNSTVPPSTHSSPPVDLRHMTSNTTLLSSQKENTREHRLSNRMSQHLQAGQARLGSRSPSSIPSSPTSVHSSSSAIFERDIEPIGPPSPPHHSHHPNPHRIARSKATEQLEQSVPSVLDSAASILAGTSSAEEEHIAVVTPARDRGCRSGVASPIGSIRSRSPSPTSARASTIPRASLLLSIPTSPSGPSISSHNNLGASPSPTRLTIQTSPPVVLPPTKEEKSSPSITTPTSAYYSTISSAESSPTTTTVEHPPQSLPTPTSTAISPSTTYAGSPFVVPLNISHPPSPTHASTKRLSFMSYSDLLASTPASMVPLSSFTSYASLDPPPHIPSVSGFTQAHSAAASINGVIRDRDSIAVLDDVGGEWEREGLGRGLEERLEALMILPGKA
ncbi:hypothetical protein SERLA73DRAFT_171568 [Serpula lacrymans var. lacrymans S7.3]|uniref:Uncharacterized protein n=1 Tax=Serpula lacrymans var. lacrymans (strain S7.3) TaxID=936435 RepID=F8QBN1_SERL3|nr:hypothetical protein SERLA73DRAFT_171568 [Serpula lacrymans var. lacrymans S7.3]